MAKKQEPEHLELLNAHEVTGFELSGILVNEIPD